MTANLSDFRDIYIMCINYLFIKNNISDFLTIENFDKQIEEALNKLDIIFGFKIQFNSPDYETQLYSCSRGNITPRKLWALIYFWFIKQSLGDPKNKSILEIGGGNGFVAYYAYLAGIKEYVIIDICTTQVNQFWNLCNLIGIEHVSLNEPNSNKTIKLVCPKYYEYFYNKNINLVCNFDGLSEYGLPIAYNYFENFHKISNLFLSINHEDNYLYNKPDGYDSIPYTFNDFYSGEKNWIIYLNKYKDLKAIFTTKEQVIEHYNSYGKNEGRTPKLDNSKKYKLLLKDYSDKLADKNEGECFRGDHNYVIELIEHL